ncbi:S8 family serine peptidase [uncultured Rossellomorea sp.]|uniref:S8 family serine peptidase n=1 Tax=uncultured Rossellomorea sp. TaxID=2837549 RepID=UPI00261FE92E|nr:S8 family serine peptidase [uncultured Rossellomorea sp.]
MKKKIGNSALVLSLSTGLLVSPLSSVGSAEEGVKPDTPLSIEELQRLNKEMGYPFQDLRVSSEIDLESSEKKNVIIEFLHEPPQVKASKSSKSKRSTTIHQAKEAVEKNHQAFKSKFLMKRGKGLSIKVNKEFKHAFNGVAIEIPQNQIKELLDSEIVKKVYVDEEISIDPPPPVEAASDEEKSSPARVEILPQIGVDKLQEEGITGEGIKVGVLDTGIDYNHPDLKDVYRGGYDFVDNDDDPMEATYEDWKKSGAPETRGGQTYYTSHGTHVSGTIAGQEANTEKAYSVQGVAPDVELYGYRVLGPYGTGPMSGIMAGVDKAVEDGMDVINLSLGAATNDPFDPLSVTVNNAMLAGTVTVISAGNNGNKMYTLGTPGAAPLPITVGASSSPMTIPVSQVLFKGESEVDAELEMMAKSFTDDLTLLENKEFEIVDVKRGLPFDLAGKDLAGKVALVEFGYLHPKGLMKTFKEKGVKAVLFASNSENHTGFFMGEGADFIPAFSMKKSALEFIRSQERTTVTFNEMGEYITKGDKLAPFSSRGPSLFTYDIKPEITAPGVHVYSTVPADTADTEQREDYTYAYERYSGTSMATPHVTGVVALLLDQNPDLTPVQIKSILMNTADPLDGDYSVYEVGAGRMDAYEAAHSDLTMTVHHVAKSVDGNGEIIDIPNPTGSLNFGGIVLENEDKLEKQTITIVNNGKEVKTLKGNVNFTGKSKDPVANGVKLTTENEVTIKPGESKTIEVQLEVPASAEKGPYDGYIQWVNEQDGDEVYQIPFGARVLGEGLAKPKLSHSVITQDTQSHPYIQNKTDIITEFFAPTIYSVMVLLKDYETGEELGVVGWYLPSDIEEGKDYVMKFDGSYNPIASFGQQIAPGKVNAKEGKYILEIQGASFDGKRYIEQEVITIDNSVASIDLNRKGGIYEVDPGKSMKINGKVKGNEVWKYENVGFKSLKEDTPYEKVKTKGKDRINLDLGLEGSEKMKTVNLLPVNVTKNAYMWHPDYQYTLIEKGTPYAYLGSEKIVDEQENLSIDLTLKNVKELTTSQYTFTYPHHLEMEEVSLHPELEKVAQEKGMDVTVETLETQLNEASTTVTVQVSTTSEKPLKIEKEMEILTLSFTQKAGSFHKGPLEIQLNDADLSRGPELLTVNGMVNIIPSTSEIKGYGIANFSWSQVQEADMEKLDVVVKATDEEGKEYAGTMTETGHYFIDDLPAQEESYMVELKIPGHFRSIQTIPNMNDIVGKHIYGSQQQLSNIYYTGGDVNGDDVIDVLDAVEIKDSWKTSTNRNADINFDGIVDDRDMWSVFVNYEARNTWAPNPPMPKLKHEGQTLEDILDELGIR